jgi:hypothetical protein
VGSRKGFNFSIGTMAIAYQMLTTPPEIRKADDAFLEMPFSIRLRVIGEATSARTPMKTPALKGLEQSSD